MIAGQGWQRMTVQLFRRMRSDLIELLDGAEQAVLDLRAPGDPRSIGWLTWHIARGQDRYVSELIGNPQLWLSCGWARHFRRLPDPTDTGLRHTSEQVAAFLSPPSELLLDYQCATHQLAEGYLMSAPDDDLNRMHASPTLGNKRTVGHRLSVLIGESFQLLGRISAMRSLDVRP